MTVIGESERCMLRAAEECRATVPKTGGGGFWLLVPKAEPDDRHCSVASG